MAGMNERTHVGPLRFGAAEYTSIRPLLYGLLRGESDAHVSFEPPGAIVESFARGRYDAALVPSIEYLRGVGRMLLAGPALVGRAAPAGSPGASRRTACGTSPSRVPPISSGTPSA